jgi:hypothetical protein
MVKRIEAVWKFLQAARNLVKNKDMSKESILRFAKQEFGEVSDFLRLQINNLFRKPKVLTSADKTYKQELKILEDKLGNLDNTAPGFKQAADRLIKKIEDLKNTKKADVVPIKKEEGIVATDAATEIVKKRTDDIASGDVTGETGDLMTSIDDSLKSLKKANKELQKTMTKPENIMDEILKGQKVMSEGYKKGNIRTAVRWFMRQEADAGKLKLSKDDYDALQVYASIREGDPIEIFRRYYGEDALQQIDEIGDVFKQGESFKHYVELLRKNVHPSVLTPKTKNIGKYDPDVLTPQQEDELRKQLLKEQEQKQLLEDFDVDPDRQPNADGGLINILKL